MRKLLSLFLLFCSLESGAQYYCKDSTLIDTYHPCGQEGYDFNPVCGCDNVTYRNSCVATYWGGIRSWVDNTICSDWFFDFRPTALSYTYSGHNPAYFQLFLRNPSHKSIAISLYVYDSFGKLWYSWNNATSIDGLYPSSALELPLRPLTMGIYTMIVVVNNEKQTIKFGKLTND